MGNTIFLIGFMGVGKTSLGKKLANRLKVPFFDTDQLIEQRIEMSINDFFAKYGEDAFRTIEKELLSDFDFTNAIVATGGGLPCFHQNMEVMNRKGITVYLNRPAKELQQRLANAKKQRPLIKELSNDELLEFIISKLDERLPYYKKASVTLDRNNQTVDEMISRIGLKD